MYSLGEREVRIFSVGLTALLVLTFGAGMLVGTFWTGPVVERARREAEEETRLAAAAAARPPALPSAADLAAAPQAPSPEPAAGEAPGEAAAVIETDAVTAPPDEDPTATVAGQAAEPQPFQAWPLPSWQQRPSWRRTEPSSAASPDPAPATVEPAPAFPSLPAVEPAVPPGVYALQLGIFSVESNASAMRARLAAQGYEPYQVEERRSLGGVAKTLYSVRVGGYSTYGEAQQQATELRSRAGMEVMIRRPEG